MKQRYERSGFNLPTVDSPHIAAQRAKLAAHDDDFMARINARTGPPAPKVTHPSTPSTPSPVAAAPADLAGTPPPPGTVEEGARGRERTPREDIGGADGSSSAPPSAGSGPTAPPTRRGRARDETVLDPATGCSFTACDECVGSVRVSGRQKTHPALRRFCPYHRRLLRESRPARQRYGVPEDAGRKSSVVDTAAARRVVRRALNEDAPAMLVRLPARRLALVAKILSELVDQVGGIDRVRELARGAA